VSSVIGSQLVDHERVRHGQLVDHERVRHGQLVDHERVRHIGWFSWVEIGGSWKSEACWVVFLGRDWWIMKEWGMVSWWIMKEWGMLGGFPGSSQRFMTGQHRAA